MKSNNQNAKVLLSYSFFLPPSEKSSRRGPAVGPGRIFSLLSQQLFFLFLLLHLKQEMELLISQS